MTKSKELLITSLALFSLFFGASNLLLPPLLGYNAGDDWFWVTIGFAITAVVIPIFGILAHAQLQGTMYDFGKKVSPIFSIIYCVTIYIISIVIPSPRTAAAIHEIAVFPYFSSSALLTSTLYFSLVLVFVLNRSKIVLFIGRFITPIIIILLLLVISIGLLSPAIIAESKVYKAPLVIGLIEGYQTLDAIGAIVVGAVIIVSLNYKKNFTFEEKKELIRKSGFIAGFSLFFIYSGLILIGAYYGSKIELDLALGNDMQRANLLRQISASSLGPFGNTILSVLISLACFTTAIGIVAGASDYFKGLFGNSKKVFIITAIISCIIGVVVGQLDFHSIIVISFPVLKFIYPITIVLILLNVIPQKYASPIIFKLVVLVTILFSIPDFFAFAFSSEAMEIIENIIPFSKYHLGWIIPAFLTFVTSNLLIKKKKY